MKAIHQNSLSIKYCSPLSHSEILVKQTLYDTFVYHQLELSWEQHIIMSFAVLSDLQAVAEVTLSFGP